MTKLIASDEWPSMSFSARMLPPCSMKIDAKVCRNMPAARQQLALCSLQQLRQILFGSSFRSVRPSETSDRLRAIAPGRRAMRWGIGSVRTFPFFGSDSKGGQW